MSTKNLMEHKESPVCILCLPDLFYSLVQRDVFKFRAQVSQPKLSCSFFFFFFFDIASIDPNDLHFPLNKLVFCLQQFGDRVPD